MRKVLVLRFVANPPQSGNAKWYPARYGVGSLPVYDTVEAARKDWSDSELLEIEVLEDKENGEPTVGHRERVGNDSVG